MYHDASITAKCLTLWYFLHISEHVDLHQEITITSIFHRLKYGKFAKKH